MNSCTSQDSGANSAMNRKHSKARHGTQMSVTEICAAAKRRSRVAAAALEAYERSSGSKWKRQDEHYQGPEEKKRREVTQPVLPPKELKRICLSSNRLEKWCHMPFFNTTVTGCFVRVATEASISNPAHCVAEIVSVMEMKDTYQFGSTRTNQVFNLRYAGQTQIVSLRSVSNQEFTTSELMQWKLAMMAAGEEVPTPEMIASKEKSIEEALNHILTEREIECIIAQKSGFRPEPLRVARRKVDLLCKQGAARSRGDAGMVKKIQDEVTKLNQERKQPFQLGTPKSDLCRPTVTSRKRPAPEATTEDYDPYMDPFTRRRTRPIIFTTMKLEAVRKRVYAELDLRYGPGFPPETDD